MPHDAKFREAGARGARTRIETLVTLGRKPELAPEQPVMEGINAARKTHPARAVRPQALRAASRRSGPSAPSGTRGRGRSKKTPEHNWASHGADVWRYLSLAWRAPMREPEPKKVPIGIPLPDVTFDQFGWSTRERV
jgi:phage terminase large subunit